MDKRDPFFAQFKERERIIRKKKRKKIACDIAYALLLGFVGGIGFFISLLVVLFVII